MNAENQKPESQPGYESRDVNIKMVALIGILGIAIVIISLVGLNQLFTFVTERQIREAVLVPVSEELLKLRAREDEILNSYGVINQDGGIYRIPIDSAISLYLADMADRESARRNR